MKTLFSDFLPVSAEEWKNKISKDLKGVDFNSLAWNTRNNIRVRPFYTSDDLKETSSPLFNQADWDICEYIHVIDEKTANTHALQALEGGASGLSFYINKKINTEVLLKDISLEHIYSQFFITNDASHVLNDLKNYYGKINPHDHKIKCFVNLDPLHLLAYFGEWHKNETSDLSSLEKLIHIPVNISLYKEAGANTVNELAIGLAHTNEYFNYLNEKNALNNKTLHFTFSVGSDFFNEIAKFRAFRKLLALLQQEYETNFPIHIHAQTSLLNKSRLDLNNNLLRTTTEAMSAAIGGCNSICILPYDYPFNSRTIFSSRIARNQQHILKEESYLNKVADVSTGSYYVEALSEQLAEKAWEQFKTIENKGGFTECLKNNFIQSSILNDSTSLIKDFEDGKLVLLGVNKFQNQNETNVSQLSETESTSGKESIINPIKSIRLAEKIESQKAKTHHSSSVS